MTSFPVTEQSGVGSRYIHEGSRATLKATDLGFLGYVPGVTTAFSAVQIARDLNSVVWNIYKLASSFFLYFKEKLSPRTGVSSFREWMWHDENTKAYRGLALEIDSIAMNMVYAIPFLGYYVQKTTKSLIDELYAATSNSASRPEAVDPVQQKKELDELRNKLRMAENSVTDLQTRHAELQQTLREKIEILEKVLSAGCPSIDDKDSQIQLEQLAKENQQLRLLIEQQEQQHDVDVGAMKKHQEEESEKFSKMQARLSESQDGTTKLQSDLERLSQENQLLQQQIAKGPQPGSTKLLLEDLETTKKLLSESIQGNAKIQSDLKSARKEKESIEAELKQIKKDFDSRSEEVLRNARKEKESIEVELKQVKKDFDSRSEEVTALQNKILFLENELKKHKH